MYIPKRLGWWCVLAMSLISLRASAALLDDDEEKKPWVEAETPLPAYPEKDGLVQFQVGSISDTRFFLDDRSLQAGADGVVRFTLVVVSPSGAQNISYEGVRCETGERRPYAFGRPDKTWSKARSDKWIRIQGGSNNHYVGLYREYFCPDGAATYVNLDKVRRALRSGGGRKAEIPS